MKRFLQSALLLVPFLIVGCGSEPRVEVTGNVLLKGTPVKSGEGVDIQVVFISTSAEPRSYTGSVSADTGVFAVSEAGKAGIPPGEYKVAVNYTSIKGADLFNGYFGPTKTTLKVNLPQAGKKELTVDLDKKVVIEK